MSQGKTDNEQGYLPTSLSALMDTWKEAVRGEADDDLIRVPVADMRAMLDALLASGVVQVTTPTETDERALYLAIESVIVDRFKVTALGLSGEVTDAVVAALASRPDPVASQGDTPADEEWVSTVEELDALPQDSIVGTTVAWKARDKAASYGGGRFWTGAANDRVASKGSHQMTLPIRVLYRPDQKPVVPVDALGFPTEVGATFRARDAKAVTEFTVVEPGMFERREGGFYEPQELDPASIADVRRAHERSEQ